MRRHKRRRLELLVFVAVPLLVATLGCQQQCGGDCGPLLDAIGSGVGSAIENLVEVFVLNLFV